MIDKKRLIDELKNIKFSVESRIAEKEKLESKDKEKRWKDALLKIHQKDEYTLEGIETWHISHMEMCPNYGDIHNQLFRE
jgi:hypothetical protein